MWRKIKLIDGETWLLIGACLFTIGLVAAILAYMYMVFSGIYHLLDKLIDKI